MLGHAVVAARQQHCSTTLQQHRSARICLTISHRSLPHGVAKSLRLLHCSQQLPVTGTMAKETAHMISLKLFTSLQSAILLKFLVWH